MCALLVDRSLRQFFCPVMDIKFNTELINTVVLNVRSQLMQRLTLKRQYVVCGTYPKIHTYW